MATDSAERGVNLPATVGEASLRRTEHVALGAQWDTQGNTMSASLLYYACVTFLVLSRSRQTMRAVELRGARAPACLAGWKSYNRHAVLIKRQGTPHGASP
jgi:hypothetical protein